MSVGFNPKLITNGLEFCIDPSNHKSYNGGNIVYDLSKNKKDCNLIGECGLGEIDGARCVVTRASAKGGAGLVQHNKINIQTLSIWCKALEGQNGINPTFIDARPAIVNGFIFSGNFGPGWSNTTGYYNGIKIPDTRILSSTILFGVNEWKNITLVRDTPVNVSDLRFFLDSNDKNSKSFAFSLITAYNRQLTYDEIEDNFLAYKGRFRL